MPKISDDKRAARRAQILDAAWICFQKNGLHATTMGDIIRTSDLSAGAVYSYFASKEDLVFAAVMTSLSALRERLEPIVQTSPLPSPEGLVRQIAEVISDFTARDGYDLKRIALLGWSEAQHNDRLRIAMQGFYLAFRDRLADVAGVWKREGRLPDSASERDVAKVILSQILGFVVQSAITGDVTPEQVGKGMADLIGAASKD